MKTIKIKVQLTPEQIQKYNQFLEELTWLWNKLLANQLYNHCLTWYDWAQKKSQQISEAFQSRAEHEKENSTSTKSTKSKRKKSKLDTSILDEFAPFDLNGIIKCPLQFGNSAFLGAACRIAVGGNYWQKDESVKIPYKNNKNEIAYKYGYKLVQGDKPYTPIKPEAHTYRVIISKENEQRQLRQSSDFDRLTILNSMRASEGLPEITIKTDFISGIIQKDFDVAWKAFLDPNLIHRKKPKFKRDKDLVKTLINNQKPPKVDFNKDIINIHGLGQVQIIDKHYQQRLKIDGFIPRTYALTKKPSGYYVCITIAHQLVEEKKSLEHKLPKVAKSQGKDSPEYIDTQSRIKEIDKIIAKYERKPKHKLERAISTGIDPGVKAVIASDNGALFKPNIKRERIECRIEKLQNQLSQLRLINDAKWKETGNAGKRPQTKNEAKLQTKISRLHEKAANSTNAFNHKLSTRLSLTYNSIAWEDTQIQNLIKQCEPKLSGEYQGYEQNGATAKAGLNRSLRMRSLGDLKAKTKYKLEKLGGNFKEPPAQNSSKTCSLCGCEGERTEQHIFICKNSLCSYFDISVQADVNAARNHRKNAGLGEAPALKYQTEKLKYSRPKRFKKQKKKQKN
ncbi:hypothetical protein NUACC21_17710 [Scytonema sp. NUACC21]